MSQLYPFLHIWYKPKRVYEVVLNRKDKLYSIPFFVAGISFGLSMLPDLSYLLGDDDTISFILALIIAIFLGTCFIFLIYGLITPILIQLVAKVWNGKASRKTIMNVNALALIPHILILMNQLVLLVGGWDTGKWNVNPFVMYVTNLSVFGLMVYGLAKAQKFSYMFALFNILFAYLLIAIPILMLFAFIY